MEQEMHVVKRDGRLEVIRFDKILNRVKKVGLEAKLSSINYSSLVMKVIDQLYDNIPTTKIDELTAEQCATLSTLHPDYSTLASYIIISNHHKNTSSSFFEVMKQLYEFKDHSGKHSPLIDSKTWQIVSSNVIFFDELICHRFDYLFDYFGFKTLERAYLMKINGVTVERPQYMWMRVAIGIHGFDLHNVKITYQLMSEKYFTHATPTLFNAGTPRPQLSSCYLIALENDSLEGIFHTLHDCASISKWAGGIGLHISNVRATGSLIRGTNGKSTGIVPMLRVFNNTARYIDQGGRRNGSFAIYLEPWHADIVDFLEMKKNHGDEEMKGRDLFYALWIPDLFMEKVKVNDDWCLFCPDECPGLSDTYGDSFKTLYEKYESENKYKRKIKSRELWFKILDSQMETGTPYICYKDASNLKSNQKNLGTIKSSNLCTEIIEYSDEHETAVCNLASIALNKFVDTKNPDNIFFDYDGLYNVVRVVTRNLNRVIDVNFYPTPKTKLSNLRHRPIGIGVQGLADVFFLMNIPFHSEKAREINKLIFETIYFASLTESNEISRQRCKVIFMHKNIPFELIPEHVTNFTITKEEIEKLDGDLVGSYSSFKGSPASQGILQFDLWNTQPTPNRYDWDSLKQSIMKYGLRNSLLVAPMPTASTSQILGNNECIEPITSNIYMRRTLAGEFIMINKYLMNDLMKLNMWNDKIKNNIIANKGSIQQIPNLSQHIYDMYKTVWEMPMKHLIDMAADRAIYICQSQSLNLWVEEPNYSILTSMHFYAWQKGLKTGIYYLRRKPKHQPQQFTIEPEKKTDRSDSDCTAEVIEDEICESCSA